MVTDVVFADVGVVKLETVVENDDGDAAPGEAHVVDGQDVKIEPRQGGHRPRVVLEPITTNDNLLHRFTFHHQ